MSDAIRQAAEECGLELSKNFIRDNDCVFNETETIQIIERAMRKLDLSVRTPAPIAGEEELVLALAKAWVGTKQNPWDLVSEEQRKHWEWLCRDGYLPIIRAYVAERVKEAVEAEREACAKMVEQNNRDLMERWDEVTKEPQLQEKIRSRGKLEAER